MNACHTQEQEKYRSSILYVCIFQLFLTFVSYNYNFVAEKKQNPSKSVTNSLKPK